MLACSGASPSHVRVRASAHSSATRSRRYRRRVLYLTPAAKGELPWRSLPPMTTFLAAEGSSVVLRSQRPGVGIVARRLGRGARARRSEWSRQVHALKIAAGWMQPDPAPSPGGRVRPNAELTDLARDGVFFSPITISCRLRFGPRAAEMLRHQYCGGDFDEAATLTGSRTVWTDARQPLRWRGAPRRDRCRARAAPRCLMPTNVPASLPSTPRCSRRLQSLAQHTAPWSSRPRDRDVLSAASHVTWCRSGTPSSSPASRGRAR